MHCNVFLSTASKFKSSQQELEKKQWKYKSDKHWKIFFKLVLVLIENHFIRDGLVEKLCISRCCQCDLWISSAKSFDRIKCYWIYCQNVRKKMLIIPKESDKQNRTMFLQNAQWVKISKGHVIIFTREIRTNKTMKQLYFNREVETKWKLEGKICVKNSVKILKFKCSVSVMFEYVICFCQCLHFDGKDKENIFLKLI